MTDGADRLVTPPLVLVVTSGLFYFLALGMLLPVIPHYVEDSLQYNSIVVGIAVGAFAVGAVALRMYAGLLGDRIGRKVLIIGGALTVGASIALYGVVHSVWWLIPLRVLTGFGEAGFFVGAATMVVDLTPDHRRGEAFSYWSVAVYSGLAFGPALGELVRGTDRYELTWVVSASLALVAALLGCFTRDVARTDPVARDGSRRLWHPTALRPGFVLFLGLIPLAGFTAFGPLYIDTLGINDGLVFLLYGLLILVVRVAGARIPDRLGGRAGGLAALALAAGGIGLIALWPTVAGLLLGTVVLAGGMSLMYPALVLLALHDVPDSERASAIGTFSSFFDASQGLGAFICGAAVALSGNRGAFVTGAVAAVLGFAVLRQSAPAPVPAVG